VVAEEDMADTAADVADEGTWAAAAAEEDAATWAVAEVVVDTAAEADAGGTAEGAEVEDVGLGGKLHSPPNDRRSLKAQRASVSTPARPHRPCLLLGSTN